MDFFVSTSPGIDKAGLEHGVCNISVAGLGGFFDFNLLQKYSLLSKIIALGLGVLWVFYKHYTPKIKEMEEKFANRPINKWLKDWLFFLLLISTSASCIFFLPFLFINLLNLILGG